VTLLKLTNTPRPYAWGSKELIPQLLGTEPDGTPQAEIWFGTHPGSPAQVIDQQGGSLADREEPLGFLVKFLAAAAPLSIQAHPTREHAAKRFAEAYPGYTDPNHKPEVIVAVTEFEALCGFREVGAIQSDLELLAQSDASFTPWLTSLATSGLEGATRFALDAPAELASKLLASADVLGSRAELMKRISAAHPNDPGLLVTILMNHVVLSPKEALYLPAGNIHAYLFGLGVEVMAASDNVLRGGLTTKPIDKPELMQILDFSELADPVVKSRELTSGLSEYETLAEDFSLYRLEPSGANMLIDVPLRGRAIAVCVAGELVISTSKEDSLSLRQGEAAYFADAAYFSVLGSGTGYLAMG
jgi:mannose-6-phosphate isomerase